MTKLVAAVEGWSLYLSADSGETWTESTSAGKKTWNAVASSDDGAVLVAAVNNGFIYLSTDSGATWATTGTAQKYWRALAMSGDGTRIFATGYNAAIHYSHDQGGSWTEDPSVPARAYKENSIACSQDGMKVAVVVWGEYPLASADGGSSWVNLENCIVGGSSQPCAKEDWTAIAMNDDGSKLAMMAFQNSIWTSENGGQSLIENSMQGIDGGTHKWKAITVSGAGPMKAMAVAEDGKFWTYMN